MCQHVKEHRQSSFDSAKLSTKNNRRMAFKVPFAYFLLIATNEPLGKARAKETLDLRL